MDLAQNIDRLHGAGAGLLVVGQGTVAQSAVFRTELGLPFPILADPGRDAYRAYAVARASWGHVASLGAARTLIGAIAGGAGGGTVVGDGRQLPGTFVIGRDGVVVAAFTAAHVGDTPPLEELIATVASIPGHGD